MKQIDEETLEQIIEQITRQVLILVQEGEEPKGNGAGKQGVAPLSAQNYVNLVQIKEWLVLSIGVARAYVVIKCWG